MSNKLRIVMAQLNLTVGDIDGNLQKHISAAERARDHLQADVIVFPELSITGYPPEDLLMRPAFLEAAEKAMQTLTATIKDIYCVVGHPQRTPKGLLNSASVIYNGSVLAICSKCNRPNYGVFDEKRYFIPGSSNCVTTVKGVPIAVLICEDMWFNEPAENAVAQGAKLILSPNASPFEITKHDMRMQTLTERTRDTGVPIFYTNCVGGQDDQVFDGGSMAVNGKGEICKLAGFFEESLALVEVTVDEDSIELSKTPFTLPTDDEKIYSCLVLGVKDYVQKNNFKGALLGLSGGIDSALTLCIAVDAIGAENVSAVFLPSKFTANMSREDAQEIAKNLKVKLQEISIEKTFESFVETLDPVIGENKSSIVDENIQSRCRGVILMALSNNNGAVVLTTGNRSELATGYATLYGDMAGGFAVLKDVPKMLVYRLANYRNSLNHVIPERTINRAPTAELAHDQKDQDTLPPYPILDEILELHLNELQGVDEIIAAGYDQEIVKRVVNWVRRNEYKRRQAPVGVRINHFAFGRDRRYPITSGFKDGADK